MSICLMYNMRENKVHYRVLPFPRIAEREREREREIACSVTADGRSADEISCHVLFMNDDAFLGLSGHVGKQVGRRSIRLRCFSCGSGLTVLSLNGRGARQ